eukprot:8661718-Prorocentrum_lima.AAC.1
MLDDELHRERARSRSTVEVIEARHSTFNSRMEEFKDGRIGYARPNIQGQRTPKSRSSLGGNYSTSS